MKRFALSLALFLGLGLGFAAWTSTTQAAPPPDQVGASKANEIRIVERPGYFETKDSVFQIASGEYTFVVTNLSGKDAGFVLTREGQKPQVIMIKHGQTGRLKTKLATGKYSYFCPIIPTPEYPLQVK